METIAHGDRLSGHSGFPAAASASRLAVMLLHSIRRVDHIRRENEQPHPMGPPLNRRWPVEASTLTPQRPTDPPSVVTAAIEVGSSFWARYRASFARATCAARPSINGPASMSDARPSLGGDLTAIQSALVDRFVALAALASGWNAS